MAGLLQYYFFPTDFFYPRPPQSVHSDIKSDQQHQQKKSFQLKLEKKEITHGETLVFGSDEALKYKLFKVESGLPMSLVPVYKKKNLGEIMQ